MAQKSKATKKTGSRIQLREPDGAETADCLVFDESTLGITRRDNSQKRTKTFSLDTDLAPPPGMDADDLADMEVSALWERIKDSVEDVHASNLRGKERNKYLLEKTVKLGGHAPKKQNHPRNIQLGMERCKVEREKKRRDEARQHDIIIAKTSVSSRKISKRKK